MQVNLFLETLHELHELTKHHVTWALRWLPRLCQVMHVNLFLETLHDLHDLTKHVM
jgi:hypothetical protein